MADETEAPDRLVPDPAAVVDTDDFARELTLARRRVGLSVRQVQAATGIVASTLGGYFAGRHSPPVESLDAILAACGIDGPEALASWHAALVRVRRVPGRRPARPAEPPYRGLESFRAQDAPWFFGRAALAAAVVSALDARAGRGPLVVVGASGAGKSSLLRAGVVATLAARPGAPPVLLTPGDRPLAALDAAPDGALLVVDQLEEVFGPAVGEPERAAFVRALCAPGRPVVVALRADFYGRALAYPELARAAQNGQVVVGPMDDDELRAAVVEPARRADVRVDDGLVERVLADLHGPGGGARSAGRLPLLSHALLATWRRGRGTRMTLADYRAAGGIAGGVAQSAEEAFGQLADDRQALARRIFLRLVHVAPDVADTRRRVERAELVDEADAAAVAAVLDLFVARRLLTADEHTVTITHEVLLTAWPRLRDWIDADRAGLAARRRLGEAARAWRDADRDPDLLLRGGRLAAAQEATASGGLSGAERAFLDSSVARDAAERRAERRRTSRLRRLVALLAVALLVAAGSAAYAVRQRSLVAAERDVAVSRQLADKSRDLRVKDPSISAQLAIAAYRVAPTAEARAELIAATGVATPARLPGPAGSTQAVAASGARGLVVTSSGDAPTAQVWRRDGPRWLRAADTPPVAGSVRAVALRADGRLLATGTTDGGVHLVDLGDPGRPAAVADLPGGPGAVTGLAFAPDGRTLLAGGVDRAVRAWDVTDPARPAPGPVLTGPTAAVQAVAVAPDGVTVVAGSADGATYLWDLRDPARVRSLPGSGEVFAVAVSPDGATLAAGGGDRAVRLWNLADPALPPLGAPLTGPTSRVNTVAFSPDGARVAFGSSDSGLRVVDLAARRTVAELPHPSPVTGAAFLDAGTLVAGEADGVARVWPVPGPGVAGFADSVFALDWSADGRVLAVGPGRRDGTASLWRVDEGAATRLGPPVVAPPGEAPFSGAAALTPDGRTLAVGRTDGSVRLWDVSAPERPVAVEPPLTGATGLVEQLTTSPDGRTLAVSSDDGTVRLWDLAPGGPRPGPTLTGPTNYVFASAFSPDGRLLAAASADRSGYLWDLRRPGAPVAVLGGPTSYAYSPAFSPDGATLAIGSADKTVRLWDVRRPDRPVPLGPPLTGPTNYVYSVAFSPDGTRLAAAGTDGTAWLWDVADPAAPRDPVSLAVSTDPLYAVAFSPDGRSLAAGGADRSVHVWTVDPGRAASALCARVGPPPAAEEWRRYVGDLAVGPSCG